MGIAPSLEQERAEVELVLESGLFDKAPRLGRFFRYVCEQHLRGESEGVKEYSIAVEALGRPPDFDPKKDSIVRVEAHRLRKRLQEYYAGPGADHPVHISIPNGQYRPHFHVNRTPVIAELIAPEHGQTVSALDLATVELPDVAPNSTELPRNHFRWDNRLRFVFIGATLLLLIAAAVLLVYRRIAHSQQAASEIRTMESAETIPGEVRILAGYEGPPFTDKQGNVWGPDSYFKGGSARPLAPGAMIQAQPDSHLLRSQRSGFSFQYDVPLRQTTYELHLLFADTEYGPGNPKGGGDGTRMFQVFLNGTLVLNQFDPLMEAGAPNRLHERVFKDAAPAADGKLHLRFTGLTGPAFLNGFSIMPSSPGRIRPVRIVSQPAPVTDSDGHFWAADEYFCGGTLVSRRHVILNRPDKALYQGERYGNFSYHIPLAPGKYTLTLHHAETWFGSPESQDPTSFDRRRFDVFADGVALLRDFDVAREAGGPNRSVDKVFHDLKPNAQGLLLLQFVPIRNYAEVNAIEVVETN